MNRNIKFDYFYGKEAEQHSFYRVPKLLFTDGHFKELSTDAKVLYGLLLDRMSLSLKNSWFDAQGRAYIYFSIEEIGGLLNCGKNKAVKSLQELDAETGIGLIEKCKKGQGKATRIYVKNFIINEAENVDNSNPEVYEINLTDERFPNEGLSIPKDKPLEVYKSGTNNTELNNTDNIYTESNHIKSDVVDDYDAYAKYIRDSLELDILIQREPFEKELLEGIYELVLETVLCKSDYVIIASNKYPAALVRSKFMKLNAEHVEYVMYCLKHNTTKVRNIKKYLLATLFNAPSTISGYYQAEVNHDMPGLAMAR